MSFSAVTVPGKPSVPVPPVAVRRFDPSEKDELMRQARQLLCAEDAVLVAHYYTSSDLQILAEETGGHVADSLEMARFGYNCSASTLVVCGVRFMGETAKILNPDKRVLMPDLRAECSLDIGCPADAFASFCATAPGRTVVVYANTGVEVKAMADWVVTSGSAVELVRHLHSQGEKIIWAPDKYLGQWVRQQTGADMLIWDGACVVHEEFKSMELTQMRQAHPGARVLAHPESPPGVLAQADVIASTSGMIRAARTMDATAFIVATDRGLLHMLRQQAPGKTFMVAPTSGKSATCHSCSQCPWMAMNDLASLVNVLQDGSNEIVVADELGARARHPIMRLLEFSERKMVPVAGDA